MNATRVAKKPNRWSFFIWEVKKNWGLALAASVLEFLFLGLPILIGNQGSVGPKSWWLILRMIAFPISLLICMILGSRLYFYLHDQEEGKELFSLPIRRSSLFTQSYIAGLVLLFVPRIISILWSIILSPRIRGTSFYGGTPLGMRNLLIQNGIIFLVLACAWAMLSLFHILCGRKGQAEWVTIMLNLLWPTMIVLFQIMAQEMLPGMPNHLSYLTKNGREFILFLFSPFIAPFTFEAWRSLYFYYWLAFFVLMSMLSLVFFLRRPAEKSGSELGQEKVFVPLRLLVSIVSAVGLAILFTSIRHYATESFDGLLPATISGLVIGSILSSLIFDMIMERGKRSLTKSLGRATFSWIPIAIAMAILMSGFFSYSEKFPSKANTEELILAASNDKSLKVSYTDPQLIESIAQAVKRNFPKENPGLDLPRKLFSRAQFEKYNLENNRYFLMRTNITWKEGLFNRQREFDWRVNGCTAALNQLRNDPAFQIIRFMEERYWLRNRNIYHSAYGMSEYHPENAMAKGQFEAREKAVLPDWVSQYASISDVAKSGFGSSLLEAFHKDYSQLSDQERLALNRNAPYLFRVQTDYSNEDDFGLFLSPNGEEGEILLPFNDQFTELKSYCEEMIKNPQRAQDHYVTATTYSLETEEVSKEAEGTSSMETEKATRP